MTATFSNFSALRSIKEFTNEVVPIAIAWIFDLSTLAFSRVARTAFWIPSVTFLVVVDLWEARTGVEAPGVRSRITASLYSQSAGSLAASYHRIEIETGRGGRQLLVVLNGGSGHRMDGSGVRTYVLVPPTSTPILNVL